MQSGCVEHPPRTLNNKIKPQSYPFVTRRLAHNCVQVRTTQSGIHIYNGPSCDIWYRCQIVIGENAKTDGVPRFSHWQTYRNDRASIDPLLGQAVLLQMTRTDCVLFSSPNHASYRIQFLLTRNWESRPTIVYIGGFNCGQQGGIETQAKKRF